MYFALSIFAKKFSREYKICVAIGLKTIVTTKYCRKTFRCNDLEGSSNIIPRNMNHTVLRHIFVSKSCKAIWQKCSFTFILSFIRCSRKHHWVSSSESAKCERYECTVWWMLRWYSDRSLATIYRTIGDSGSYLKLFFLCEIYRKTKSEEQRRRTHVRSSTRAKSWVTYRCVQNATTHSNVVP